MTQRTIVISDRARHKLLHIEAPGCIINIRVGLSDTDGRKVTNVSIMADGDRYAGDPEWWIDGDRDARNIGATVRVVCTGYKVSAETDGDADPDAHLIGTPWDTWRNNVATLLNITPAEVSRMHAYESFNTLVSEEDFVAGLRE